MAYNLKHKKTYLFMMLVDLNKDEENMKLHQNLNLQE